MNVHIQSVDIDVWDNVTNEWYEPHVVTKGVAQNKLKVEWTDDDKKNKKKVQYDLNARNMLISSLGVNEYHSVSNCKTSMRVPKTSNNQRSILSSNNMNSFTWRMVNPSPPCK